MSGPFLPTTHELKVWPEYFAPLDRWSKTFEFRRDDREPRYAVGDLLRLREWVPVPSMGDDENGCLATFAPHYTGRECWRSVIYVARGGVIPEGYCCLSIEGASPFAIAAALAVSASGSAPQQEGT